MAVMSTGGVRVTVGNGVARSMMVAGAGLVALVSSIVMDMVEVMVGNSDLKVDMVHEVRLVEE